MNSAQSDHLLEVKGLRVAFGGHEVVHGLDFHIRSGERVALVGESGSGKTVTALSLLRLLPEAQVSGEAWLRSPSRDVKGQGSPGGLRAATVVETNLVTAPMAEVQDIRGRDVAMVFQEPMTALNPLMTIENQIFEILIEKRGFDKQECPRIAIELVSKTGIKDAQNKIKSYPHQLSGGQRQRAMIAMALASQPQLLLADEPTTALDVTVRAQILDLIIAMQRDLGMAVLLITHDLQLVKRFADRVVIMEKGHIVEQGAVAEVFAHPQHAYTRKLLDSAAPRRVTALKPPTPQPADAPLLVAEQLQVDYPVPLPGFKGWFTQGHFTAVQGVSLSIRPGQTLGVVGESGSGKSTLALAALGLLPHGGSLRVMGQSWLDKALGADGRRALRKQIQVVFQDPFSSLSPRLTVEEIVGEGLRVHARSLSKQELSVGVIRALQEVGLTESEFPNLLSRYPHEFSGGQRQRIAIARALIVEPRLRVLDEPTSALDVTIQKQVIGLLQDLQDRLGLAYLLITHDVSVIRAMAHDVIVMRDARIVEQGSFDAVFSAPQQPYTRALIQAAA
jgi:microcin C transport system ATP-binding protein